MLQEFIQAAEKCSIFTVSCLDGALMMRGNMLSPVDAQAVGLASSLISVDLMTSTDQNLDHLAQVSKTIADEHHEMTPDEMTEALRRLKSLNPEKLRQIGEHQSKVICQCIREGSIDGGETWERMQVVMLKEQQSAENNRLWVGILPTEDRVSIIDIIMTRQDEAAEQLRTFRK